MRRQSYEINHLFLVARSETDHWLFCTDLARELSKHGIQTTIAISDSTAAKKLQESDGGAPHVKFCFPPSDHQMTQEANGQWFVAKAHECGADIIQVDDPALCAFAWPAPIVLTVRNGESIRTQLGGSERVECRKLIRTADMVVASTETLLDEVEAQVGELHMRRGIPLGIAGPAQFDVLRKKKCVLAASRHWREDTISAARLVAQESDWPVYLMGELEGIRLPRTAHINLLGRLSPKAAHSWFESAAVYVHADTDPGGERLIIEAASCGATLVLPYTDDHRATWGDCALYYTLKAEGDLQSAVFAITSTEGLCCEYGRRAKLMSQDFGSETMAWAYLFAYQELKQSLAFEHDLFELTTVADKTAYVS